MVKDSDGKISLKVTVDKSASFIKTLYLVAKPVEEHLSTEYTTKWVVCGQETYSVDSDNSMFNINV